MTIRSKIETSMLIAALSVGIANTTVNAAQLRAPVTRAPVAGRVSVPGAPTAPTLPGCNSQATCRTAGGGYLNGHPGSGPGGGK